MKLKSVFGAFVAFGAMALMAVGVQAATYSAGVVSPSEGVAEVPVIVTPSDSETSVSVNGYIMKLTYDKTKVTPKVSATKDATGADCYATVGTDFGGTNTVLVSDKTATDGNNETLAVAWASSTPVSVTSASTMAFVDFTVADGTTGDIPITVELTALTNDGSTDTASTATVANGSITINAEKFLRGDANGDGVVDVKDAARISQYLLNIATIEDANMKKADANADDTVDVKDAARISQYLLGLATIPE
ncbi:MAG: dockerin type I domain-containing protein [Lachnospirales bacterium]